MKYEIEGISENKVIKDIFDNGKYIEVRYLDGSSDIIESGPDNYRKVIKRMNEQANDYVKDLGKSKSSLKEEISNRKKYMIILNIFILVLTACITLPNGFLIGIIPNMTVLLIGNIYQIHCINKAKDNIIDLEKYDLFIKTFETKIKEFNRIKAKEASLTKSHKSRNELDSITKLDSFTLQQLKRMIAKVDRYNELLDDSNLQNAATEESKTFTKKRNI